MEIVRTRVSAGASNLSAPISGTGDGFLLETLVPLGASDVAWSPDQTRLYAAMWNGNIKVFDIATGTNLATWDVGTMLGGISISEDGSFLLTTEQQQMSSSILYKVSTSTGSAETFSIPGHAFHDVEIVNGSTALLTDGQEQVTQFNLTSSTFSSLSGAIYVINRSVLTEDGRYTLFAEPGIGSGPLLLYDDIVGGIVASGDNYQSSNTGFNFGHQAVSEEAGLVLQFIGSSINIYDIDLKFKQAIYIGGLVDGLAFDEAGEYFYVYFIETGYVAKYFVGDWTKVDQYYVGTSSWHNNNGFGSQLLIDDSGKYITVLDSNADRGRLQVIDLTIRDETFAGTAGADEFAGGKGDDTYIVDHAGDVVVEYVHEGRDIIYSAVSYSLNDGSAVENLSTLSWEATDALSLTGNGLANTLIGNAGANVLNGAGGADTMFGREGDDAYFVDSAGDQAIDYAGQGIDTVHASLSYSLTDASEIENLSTVASAATDPINLTGNGLANTLIGNGGVNQLNGAGGSDLMYGREGNDIYIVDSAGDQAIESSGQGIDIIYSAVSYALSDASEIEALATLSFEGTASLNLTGNGLANTLIGNDGNNQLDGRGGADVMVGRAGGDIYLVDHATDAIFESVGGGYDVIYSAISFALTNDQEIEGLSTITWELTTAIDLTGNSADNYLIGNAGSNLLDGKGGSDVLQGREGTDIFAFTTVPGAGNADLILDFAAADDTIRLEGAAFGGMAAGPLDPNAFVIGAAAQDGEDRIVYNQATGQLFFDADGSGGGAAILFATLQGAPVITVGDFAMI